MLCQKCGKEIPEGKSECEFCRAQAPLAQNAHAARGGWLRKIIVFCLLIYGVNGLTSLVYGAWALDLIRESFSSMDSSSGPDPAMIFSQIAFAFNHFDKLAEIPMFWLFLLATVAAVVIEIVASIVAGTDQ